MLIAARNHLPGLIAALLGTLALAAPDSALAQQGTVDLNLQSGTAVSGTQLTVNLTKTSSGGAVVAALQWNILASAVDFSTIQVVPTAAASAAGKNVQCASAPSGIICVGYGFNLNPFPDGVIATVTLAIAPNISTSVQASATLANTQGATAVGMAVPVSPSGATVTIEASTTPPPPPALPTFIATDVVNSASFAGGSISPGEIISIFGSALGPAAGASLTVGANGLVTTTLGGTEVLFDGVPAPLIYAGIGQINAVVPYEVAGKTSTQVQISCKAGVSPLIKLPVGGSAPGIFTYNASGKGQGAILNQDGTLNSPTNPAERGSAVVLYMTGEGQTTPPGVDGKPLTNFNELPHPVLPVIALIGGLSAKVDYAGGAPDFVAGLMQVNLTVPTGVATGASVPIEVTVGTVAAPAGVTLAVK